MEGDITYALLPHAPHTKQLAAIAHAKGKELILHLPMSSILSRSAGPGTLTAELSHVEFKTLLEQNLQATPHIIGVNNHMGSLLTQQPQQMHWLMRTLKKHGLYFLDSRTTADSLAYHAAKAYAIDTVERDIFLDNNDDLPNIDKAFTQLIQLAKRKGRAVAIGHPRPNTLNYLAKNLPRLKQAGIRLRKVSALFSDHENAHPSDKPVDNTVHIETP